MAGPKQTGRLMQFSVSTLDKDALAIESLDGAEGISRLFEYHVDLLATVDTEIDPKDLIGNKVAVAINLNDVQGTKWISGIIASFEQCDGDTEFDVYRARIVPSMWQLTLSANCRVFQNKTVVDIFKEVIAEYGLSVSDQTTTTYKPLEYCTQYSESDFHFVSRILEESGIFYWFEHTDQDNKIVLGDARTVYADCPLSASFPYALNYKGAEGGYGAWVSEFSSTSTMVSGKHSTADFDFRTYKRVDADPRTSASPFGKNAYDQYLYSAGEEGYTKDATTPLVKDVETLFLDSRLNASDCMSEVYRGSSNARSFCAGYTFTLSKHSRDDWNQKYLLTAVTHHADQSPPYRTSAGSSDAGYTNRFTAIPSTVAFKPALTFMKPKIYGPQTAIVVVSTGEEIWIDKYGRINIQFMWDKVKQNKPDNTWVRVAQQWAGNGWGTFFWPRLNDEVVVAFLNGDPDNPLVVGSVYNGVNVPKYALPDHSTISGVVTRSSKGGGASNANELRFEDKKGSEQIFMNAEKDYDLHVEHDWHSQIDNEQHTTIKSNQFEKVGGDSHLQVTGKQLESVGGDAHLAVTGKQIVQVGGDRSNAVTGNIKESVGQNYGMTVGQNLSQQVGSGYSLQAGQNQDVQVGMNCNITAGQTINLMGGMSVNITGGSTGVSIVGPGGFISITEAGVAIMGTMVMINSGGGPTPASPASPQSPASPDSPTAPTAPTFPGDGPSAQTEGTASFPAGSSPSSPAAAGAAPPSAGAGAAPLGASAPPSLGGAAAGAAGAAAGVAGAAGGAASQAENAAQQAVNQAQQAAQQATQQAAQAAQQAANQAQQAANQAKQAAQQAEQQAQQAVNQVVQEARQAYGQASQAVQQAEQQVSQAAAQGQAAAQQALSQAQQQAQQCAQAASQAVQQAQQEAQQVGQQAQQAAAQAQQAAQQAQQQAQQAAQQVQQQAQQAAAQAQQQAQQAVQQGQQAVQQAQQQAQQVAQQAQQAAQQAQQQAQQAAQQAQQAAQQAQQQAQQAGQQVQQAASQAQQQAQQASQAAQQSASQAISQAGRGF